MQTCKKQLILPFLAAFAGFAVYHKVDEFKLRVSVEEFKFATESAELAVEKGVTSLLMPKTARRQLYELSDDMATKVDIQFYQDARDGLLKALVE